MSVRPHLFFFMSFLLAFFIFFLMATSPPPSNSLLLKMKIGGSCLFILIKKLIVIIRSFLCIHTEPYHFSFIKIIHGYIGRFHTSIVTSVSQNVCAYVVCIVGYTHFVTFILEDVCNGKMIQYQTCIQVRNLVSIKAIKFRLY